LKAIILRKCEVDGVAAETHIASPGRSPHRQEKTNGADHRKERLKERFIATKFRTAHPKETLMNDHPSPRSGFCNPIHTMTPDATERFFV
jgi:hypothetical protein